MTELPQAFLSQMAAQLKGEMAAFLRTYDEPYQRGLRVNPWKRPTLLPEDCGERVPWEANGHYLALTSTAGADVLVEDLTAEDLKNYRLEGCLLYTSPSPRDCS